MRFFTEESVRLAFSMLVDHMGESKESGLRDVQATLNDSRNVHDDYYTDTPEAREKREPANDVLELFAGELRRYIEHDRLIEQNSKAGKLTSGLPL